MAFRRCAFHDSPTCRDGRELIKIGLLRRKLVMQTLYYIGLTYNYYDIVTHRRCIFIIYTRASHTLLLSPVRIADERSYLYNIRLI